MKELIKKFEVWKKEKRRELGQWYADLIIKQLDNSKNEREFHHWMSQGINLDAMMVYKYGIYLD